VTNRVVLGLGDVHPAEAARLDLLVRGQSQAGIA